MATLDNLVSQLGKLQHRELNALSEKILILLQEFNGESSEGQVVTNCRKCGHSSLQKFGRNSKGKQRYRCKACMTIFTDTSFSVISNTHKSVDSWKTFIQETMLGHSLHCCARAAHISERTAFVWRHKILNALQNDQTNRVLGGIIEMDDTYMPISYKGNHSSSCHFQMPRPAHKRGTDNREQVVYRMCVMCALERNGQVYGEVLGKGQPSMSMLSYAYKDRILPDSIVISDKAHGFRKYFNKIQRVELIQLLAHVRPKSMNSPPEVKGVFHIQNINNLHARFRRFLTPYNGVSTKYLNHYLNLFIWVENHKKTHDMTLEEELYNHLYSVGTYVTADSLFALPAVPHVS